MTEVPVLISGGGPVGLSLACELGLRGVRCLVLERNPGINAHPRANVVASRTMEHFHRWGIAERVARAGLPLDYPVQVVFSTRIMRREIFRFSFPSYEDCMHPTPALLAELPDLGHSRYFKTSVGQSDLEPVLRDFAAAQPGVTLRFGWQLETFTQDDAGVTAVVSEVATGRRETLRAGYLAACDGGRSEVRARLGIALQGQGVLGQFVGIYFRSTEFMRRQPVGRATLYWSLNAQACGAFIAIDGHEKFTFQRSLWPDESPEDIDPRATIDAAFGAPLQAEILSVQPWKAHQLVAERLREGRVFLLGDAAHLFVPTGGFGMNTGISDAVDLGWKLAAVAQGWGGPGLLASYDAERRPVGVRNTTEAADNYLKMLPAFEAARRTEQPGAEGDAACDLIARGIAAGRKHFHATGIHLGYRYEASPICVPDGTPAPPDHPQVYTPSARPGSRAPHVMLADGRSTLDLVGPGFTLFDLGAAAESARQFDDAARRLGIPLRVARLNEPPVAQSYERRLVLVRPDGHVAWRGDAAPADAVDILLRVTGRPAERRA